MTPFRAGDLVRHVLLPHEGRVTESPATFAGSVVAGLCRVLIEDGPFSTESIAPYEMWRRVDTVRGAPNRRCAA